jgi:hypothetical protein
VAAFAVRFARPKSTLGPAHTPISTGRYSKQHPGRAGTAATFEQARAHFEIDWRFGWILNSSPRSSNRAKFRGRQGTASGVCTENLIRVDDVMESPKLAE